MKFYYLFLLLLSNFLATAQYNSNFEYGLELIAQSEAADPFFQLDADQSNSMIIEISEGSGIRSSTRNRSLTNLLRDIKAENRYDFSRPIQIMFRNEFLDYGFEPDSGTTVYFFREDEKTMNIILSSTQLSNGENYIADFRFEKKFGNWEIVGQDVRSSRY